MKQKSVKSKIILTVLGVIFGLLFISPFWIIVTNSFKTKKELFLSTLSLPSSFNLQNYKDACEALDFFKTLGTSLIITICSIVLIVIFTSLAGWTLQRSNTKKSNIILMIFVLSMLVPFQSVMLPLVKIMGKIKSLQIPG